MTIGSFRDQVPQYDMRRLYLLKQYLVKKQNNNRFIQANSELTDIIQKILKNDKAFNLISNLINDGDTLNVNILDKLLLALEASNAYRSIKPDTKNISTLKA